MSLIQGGSGFPFFAKSFYDYICGRDICSIDPALEEIPDVQLKATLTEVYIYIIHALCLSVTKICTHV